MNVFKTLCLVVLASSASMFGMEQTTARLYKSPAYYVEQQTPVTSSTEAKQYQRPFHTAYTPNAQYERPYHSAYTPNQTFASVTYTIVTMVLNGVPTQVLVRK